MDKISAAGTKDGITTEQRGALSTYQGVIASGGAANQAKVALDVALLNPLAQAYSDKVAGEDPAAVARLRSERNERTFTAICRSADPGFDALPADKKAKAILEAKIKTVIGEIDYEGLFGLGVTQSPHSSGIKTITHEEVNPETGKKRFVSEPDPEALKALDDHLLAMGDKDLAFFASYSANGMSDADNLFTASAEQSGIGCGPVFKNALRDGTVSMSDIPREAVTMLETCIKSQMFALQEGTTHLSMDVPVRGLMKSDQYNGPVGLGLFERLQSGFKASGISPVPDVFVTTGKESASQISQRLGNPRNNGFTRMWGFGTMDLMRVLKLFDEMGVSLAPLGGDDVKAKIDVYEKVICLSMIAAMDGFKLDDLPEFTQRTMGKSFDKVTYADVMSAMSRLGIVSDGFMADNLLVTDPLSGLKGGAKTVKQLFAGELALSGASLSAGEVTELLSNMRSLGAVPLGKQKSVSMNIQGTAVQLTRLAGGGLSVSIGGMPFRSAFDTNGVVRMLENEITSKPGSFGPDVVKGALPPPADVKSGKIPLVRARELYAKTAAAKTGTLPVMFSAYSTDELYDVAMKAVDGKFSEKDLPTNPPGTYNSGAMIEMHEALSLTSSAEIDAKVQLATKAGRSIVERRTVPPDAQNFVQSYMRLSDIVTEIDNTVADIMTASASIYYDTDVVNPVPGESKVFAGIRDVMRAFVGSSDSPCSIAVIDDAAEAADAYLETQEGKDELKTLTHDIDKIRNVLKPFIDQMATVECVTRSELNPVSVHAGAPAIVSSVRAEVERLLTLEAEGKLETKEGQETMDRLEEELGLCARRSAEDLIRHMSTEHRGGGESTFLGVAKRVDMSMTDVCTGVIYAHQEELQPLVIGKFGTFGAFGFALSLKTAVDAADADVARRKKIEPRLAAENRKVDPGERLSGQEMSAISRAATPFLIQSPRPDAASGWCSSKDKRGAFLTAVEYNLSRVSTALGIAPGQHLSATAVRHAALSFGLYDSKVIGSVASLSDGDYNQLLAEASQMDAVNGGSELATALAALRTAKPILDEIAK